MARARPSFAFGHFAFCSFVFALESCFDFGTFAFGAFRRFGLRSFFCRFLSVGLGDFPFALFHGFFGLLLLEFFIERCDFRRVGGRVRAPENQRAEQSRQGNSSNSHPRNNYSIAHARGRRVCDLRRPGRALASLVLMARANAA